MENWSAAIVTCRSTLALEVSRDRSIPEFALILRRNECFNFTPQLGTRWLAPWYILWNTLKDTMRHLV